MTNYERIQSEVISPEILAVLLSESVFLNTCMVCSERFVPYENMCDKRCTKHIFDWLQQESSDGDPYERVIELLKKYVEEEKNSICGF